MVELLHEAMAPVNIVYTGLLLLVLIYWLSVIIGALDIGTLDVDFDFDADVDIDVDADLDTGFSGGWFAGALQFFNFGKLPFMIILTFITLCLWSGSVLANYYWGHGSIAFALALFFPMLFTSLVITKGITTPLIPFFKNLDGVEPVDYIGMTCKLLLPASDSALGQAEVMVDESALLINVMVTNDKPQTINKGDEAIILAKAKERDYYIIDVLAEI